MQGPHEESCGQPGRQGRGLHRRWGRFGRRGGRGARALGRCNSAEVLSVFQTLLWPRGRAPWRHQLSNVSPNLLTPAVSESAGFDGSAQKRVCQSWHALHVPITDFKLAVLHGGHRANVLKYVRLKQVATKFRSGRRRSTFPTTARAPKCQRCWSGSLQSDCSVVNSTRWGIDKRRPTFTEPSSLAQPPFSVIPTSVPR